MNLSPGKLKAIISKFKVPSPLVRAAQLKRGHIHQTFVVETESGDSFLLQCLNEYVFQDIEGLMANIALVTDHLKGRGEPSMTIVPALDEKLFYRDDSGAPWRVFEYIRDSESFNFPLDANMALDAAISAGRFERLVSELPVGRLNETIPNFHNLPARYRTLTSSIESNIKGRRSACEDEIQDIVARKSVADLVRDPLESGEIPVRVVHNDLKLNNILFSKSSGKAICLVDLDTCMPTSFVYDFGNLLAFSAIKAEEGEVDLSKIKVDESILTALCEGFLSETAAILTSKELELLPFAPALFSLNDSVRFLTDFLDGDKYFSVVGEMDNLFRCRFHLTACKRFESVVEDIRELVMSAAGK